MGETRHEISASEKLEIIRIVEHSHLPVRRTLDKLGVLPGSFYRWYDRYQTGGVEALADKPSKPSRVWNRIPDDIRKRIVTMALDEPELSPRELAARFTDTQNYFVSEASVYRLLKAHDLITSAAFIVIKAADAFKDKTTAINQLWQTDFTYLKVIGWVWFYLSTILDDFSRYIIAWKLCATTKAEDVTDTLQLALCANPASRLRLSANPRRAPTTTLTCSFLGLGRSALTTRGRASARPAPISSTLSSIWGPICARRSSKIPATPSRRSPPAAAPLPPSSTCSGSRACSATPIRRCTRYSSAGTEGEAHWLKIKTATWRAANRDRWEPFEKRR